MPILDTACLWRYGLLGAPLAFVSLPLYVTLPHHYAQQFGAPLAALGGVLLATRAADAVVDPWIGRWVDAGFRHGPGRAWAMAAAAGLLMALGFAALWQPPALAQGGLLLAWLTGCLLVTYFAFSVLSVVHQAWGARWGGEPPQRARIVAWREGAALVGVLAASLLPLAMGLGAVSATLALLLALGLWTLRSTDGRAASPGDAGSAPAAPARSGAGAAVAAEAGALQRASATAANPSRAAGSPPSPASPWSQPAFRALIVVFVVNGLASAIPATLLSFFISDVLRAKPYEPLFLGLYFAAAAIGLPLWLRTVHRLGLAAAWRAGMLLAVAAFAVAPLLGRGDIAAFALVCIASGLALGADLALPAALLTGVVRDAGQAGTGEGRFFGWWTCAGKLNLALAAGLSLPLLALAGYQSGSTDASALTALALAYGALPLALKLVAAALLWRAERRHATFSRRSTP